MSINTSRRVAVSLVLMVAGSSPTLAAVPLPSAGGLMDWAERAYPQHFPGPQADQSLAPYVYRYYPTTGNYVGVAGSSIYLLGPVAGSDSAPLYVGELAGFACQVLAPQPCAATPARAPRLVASTNGSFALAVKADGSVWGWGGQTSGQFGDGRGRTVDPVPVQVAAPGTAVGVVAGTSNAGLLTADGEVRTSGSNYRGVLGLGYAEGRVESWTRAVVIDGVRRLASGDSAQVAVRRDGTAWRWGENAGGGSLDAVRQAQRLGSFGDFVDVAMTRYAAFLLRGDGTVWFWGRESGLGESGGAVRSGMTSGDTVLQVPGVQGVVALATGNAHVLALKGDGTVWSWGSNNYAQLGYQGVMYSATAKAVPGVANVIAVAAGGQHSIALHADGTVTTWGSVSEVRCQGTGQTPPLPARVAGVNDAVEVAAAGYYGTFIVRRDGSVWACGNNGANVLGLGAKDVNAQVPTRVPDLNLD